MRPNIIPHEDDVHKAEVAVLSLLDCGVDVVTYDPEAECVESLEDGHQVSPGGLVVLLGHPGPGVQARCGSEVPEVEVVCQWPPGAGEQVQQWM